jgi:hypothetical protein
MTQGETVLNEHGQELLRRMGVDGPRAPAYVVDVDGAVESERHRAGLLLVDILAAADIEDVARPKGPGEDENWLNRMTDEDGMSNIDQQRALARQGRDASHRLTRQFRGRYPDVVTAIVRSLAQHGHRVLSMTDAAGGAILVCYVPRPTFGGPNGHLRIDIALPAVSREIDEASPIVVDGIAECQGVRRSVIGDLLGTELWKEGRRALEHVIEDAELLLAGEEPRKRGWRALYARVAGSAHGAATSPPYDPPPNPPPDM